MKQLEKELKLYDLVLPITNGFDYGEVPVIKPTDDYCDWDIVKMEWGFIPSYLRNREAVERFRKGFKDPATGKFKPPMTTLNAMGEEMLLPGKMFREAALKRRCLFLSTGFFEWRHLPKMGKKGEPLKATEKIPYHIKVKNREVFFVAGIWQQWTDKDTGESVDTCGLITTKANELMQQVHNSKERMPCILNEAMAGQWIGNGLSEDEIKGIAMSQFPASEMEAYTIKKDFREAPDPAERFAYEGVPELVGYAVKVEEAWTHAAGEELHGAPRLRED